MSTSIDPLNAERSSLSDVIFGYDQEVELAIRPKLQKEMVQLPRYETLGEAVYSDFPTQVGA
jgi:hypothetical protein